MKNKEKLLALVKASYNLENYLTDLEYFSNLPALEKTKQIDIAQYNLRTALVLIRSLIAEDLGLEQKKIA